jgi:transposase InsO family protein
LIYVRSEYQHLRLSGECVAFIQVRQPNHHPEGNSDIERFHRSLKEEEVWTSEYRSLNEARENIGRYLEEYNHDRPHRGVDNRTPNEAFLSFAVLTKNQALNV